MPGILDQLDQQITPQGQGLLAAGFQGLQSSGFSRTPVSLGQIIGQAGQAGLGQMNNAFGQQTRLALAKEQIDAMKEQRAQQAALMAEQVKEKQRVSGLVQGMSQAMAELPKDALPEERTGAMLPFLAQINPLEFYKAHESLNVRIEESRNKLSLLQQQIDAKNVSAEEKMKLERERLAEQSRHNRILESLSNARLSLEPAMPVADPNSSTGYRYARRSEAIGMEAPPPVGSAERKEAQPLSSGDLSKWSDRSGNHPPAGTTLADLKAPNSPYKVMTAAQSSMNAKFKGAQSAMDKLSEFIDKIWDPNDNESSAKARAKYLAKFKVERLTQGNDGVVAQFDAFSKGTIPTLVRAAGEVGNLNEFEQQRALQMIPKEGDTAPVARAKMNNLEDWLYKASNGAVGLPSFASESEAAAAAKAGKIKSGDRIKVKGRRAVWED